jgi:hypothetical protein
LKHLQLIRKIPGCTGKHAQNADYLATPRIEWHTDVSLDAPAIEWHRSWLPGFLAEIFE